MTPTSRRVWQEVAEHSVCLCGKGDVPCLKHHKEAFEVFFCAKHSHGPWLDGASSGVFRFLEVESHGSWDYELLDLLCIPGFIRKRDAGVWVTYYAGAGRQPNYSADCLSTALQRYSQWLLTKGPPEELEAARISASDAE